MTLGSRKTGSRHGCEEGSGSVLGVALIGVVVAVSAVMLPLGFGLAGRQAAIGAADAAALAAADVAVGILPGYPCEEAERVARANGATLSDCEQDGLIATVRVTVPILGFAATATSTAGPPPPDQD